MCTLIKEYCHDYLGEFNLQVLGWSQHRDNDEYVRAVGVEFFASQRDALDARIFELRDVWWCKQRQLSTVTGVENLELFVWPPLPLPKPLSGGTSDPLVKPDPGASLSEPLPDPWRAYTYIYIYIYTYI